MSDIRYEVWHSTPPEVFAHVNWETIEDVSRLLTHLKRNHETVVITPEQFFRAISSSYLIVALERRKGDRDRVVGMVTLCEMVTLHDNVGYVHDLVVAPDYAGKDVAHQLMLLLEQTAIMRGINCFELTCHYSREAAQAFYRRRGYVVRETTVFVRKLTPPLVEG